jgi:hypothetical protein
MAVLVVRSLVVVMVVVIVLLRTPVLMLVLVLAEDRALGCPEMAHWATVAGGLAVASH